MKVLYIGQYSEGTTSRMRGDQMNIILKPKIFHFIDTHIPFYSTNRIYRSFGFRYKKGPLISSVNNYIISELKKNKDCKFYDLIWVDKAVFLTKNTTKKLKLNARKLIHFTPDPAFTYHRSNHFLNSLKFYDYLVTTKSYELEDYINYSNRQKVILTTQGFDKGIHSPSDNSNPKDGFIFIGHHEREREEIIEGLLKERIPVKLAGISWNAFAIKHQNNPNLEYYGKGIYGKHYVDAIANSQIAWGAISKWVPEKHTTRTFEIPACGTALLTERNEETISFFKEDEAIFYSSPQEMLEKIQFFLKQEDKLEQLTKKGLERVHKDGYDYESILRKIFDQVLP